MPFYEFFVTIEFVDWFRKCSKEKIYQEKRSQKIISLIYTEQSVLSDVKETRHLKSPAFIINYHFSFEAMCTLFSMICKEIND